MLCILWCINHCILKLKMDTKTGIGPSQREVQGWHTEAADGNHENLSRIWSQSIWRMYAYALTNAHLVHALFRFFPVSITFWARAFYGATDLSSYDVLFYLPFDIPFLITCEFVYFYCGPFLPLFIHITTCRMLISRRTLQWSMFSISCLWCSWHFSIITFRFDDIYVFSNLINIIQTVVTKTTFSMKRKSRATPKRKG